MPKPSTPASRQVSSQEFALLTARPETRILFVCAVMFVAGLAQAFRQGWSRHDLLLPGGAVAAALGMFLFGRSLMNRERSWASSGFALAGFAPFLFGCYLVLYRGLWNARTISAAFSLGRLLAALAFIYFGYRLVYWTWQLSEIGEALRTGRLVVSDSRPSA